MNTFRQFLQAEHERRRTRNPRYTLSAFARDLALAPATLHQIVAGKRRVSHAKMREIIDRFDLDATGKAAALELVSVREKDDGAVTAHSGAWQAVPLTDDLVADWLTYATLSAFELRDTESSVEWFARRLDVPRRDAQRVLDGLDAAGLIDRSVSPWRLTGGSLTSGRGISREALRRAHLACLAKAAAYVASDTDAARLTSASERGMLEGLADVSGMTFSIDRRRLPEAFVLIQSFRRNLASFLSGGPESLANDEVYRLNVQLFPLTK